MTSSYKPSTVQNRRCLRAFAACKESCVRQPGASGFVIGLVIFVLNLPDGQVLFFVEIQIKEGL